MPRGRCRANRVVSSSGAGGGFVATRLVGVPSAARSACTFRAAASASHSTVGDVAAERGSKGDATSGCGGSFIGVVTSSSTQNAGACKLPADVGLGGSVRAGAAWTAAAAVFRPRRGPSRGGDGLRDRPRVLEDFGAGGGDALDPGQRPTRAKPEGVGAGAGAASSKTISRTSARGLGRWGRLGCIRVGGRRWRRLHILWLACLAAHGSLGLPPRALPGPGEVLARGLGCQIRGATSAVQA